MRLHIKKFHEGKKNHLSHIDEKFFKNNENLISFDTNILLRLYEEECYDTINSFFQVLKNSQASFFLTNHTLVEFLNTKDAVIERLKKEKDLINDKLENLYQELYNDLVNIENIDLEDHLEQINFIIDDLKEKNKIKDVNSLEFIEKLLNNDFILEKLKKYFDGKITRDYDIDEIHEIEKEGNMRYNSDTPPGFFDKEGKKKQNLGRNYINESCYTKKYGDLIIWKQLIEEAKGKKCKNLLFVTDEKKTDWIDKNTSNPNNKLIFEFKLLTKANFYIIDFKKFLEMEKHLMDKSD